MKIAAICINSHGEEIYNKLNKHISVELYKKEEAEKFSISEVTEKLMKDYDAIIFLSSTGIAVRAIAPYIKSKDKDPAILVIDIFGRFVISLLSGHLGGANELTLQIAKLLGAEPIITTATDNMDIMAPDIIAKNNGLIIDDLKKAKEIAARLVAGEKVVFIDEKKKISVPRGYEEDALSEEDDQQYSKVIVTNKTHYLKQDKTLCLIRKNIILGIGCRKNYSVEKMKENVEKKLEELNIDKRAVKIVASVEIKKDEEAIKSLAKHLNAEFKVAEINEIKNIQHKFKGSDFVEKTLGVRAVCEPCVELFSGKIITEKFSIDGMTLCIGVEEI